MKVGSSTSRLMFARPQDSSQQKLTTFNIIVLTNRQHGVATIWLVATLGSKSALRKVTRKAILDVDVQKACDTIQDPSAPMALRLQGNLLYGVSRVYSQQCGYVLADTQSFKDRMLNLVMIMKKGDNNLETTKTRPEQLNLPDDPAFLPDVDMTFDLSMFEIGTDSSRLSSLLSVPSLHSSQSSLPTIPAEGLLLELPSTDPPPAAEFGAFDLGGGTSSVMKTASRTGRVSVFEDTGLIEDAGFEFDAEGNMIDLHLQSERPISAVASLPGRISAVDSDSGISARVRAEHIGSGFDLQLDQILNAEEDGLLLGNYDQRLPPAAPSFPTQPLSATPVEEPRRSASARPDDEEETSESAEAPQRGNRSRVPKVLEIDDPQELSNAELKQWNVAYLDNMAQAALVKSQHKAPALARKNAAVWVLGQGLAGVGLGQLAAPLQMFTGQALFAALAGQETLPAGIKRTRTSSTDTGDEEARRVRSRLQEETVRRGQEDDRGGLNVEDGDGPMLPGEDLHAEVGLVAPSPLPNEFSSQFPWNASTSRYGSSVRHFSAGFGGGGGAGGVSSGIGGLVQGMDMIVPRTRSRHGSRITSASPLLGRGDPLALSHRYSSLELPDQAQSNFRLGSEDDAFRPDNDGQPLGAETNVSDDAEFQLHGPAAAVNTQTAANPQWLAAALDSEANNFLAFLSAKMDAQKQELRNGDKNESDTGRISFTTLLPPDQHSKTVAAQGLLHVLTLATKGDIKVHQEEPFGLIEMGLVGQVD